MRVLRHCAVGHQLQVITYWQSGLRQQSQVAGSRDRHPPSSYLLAQLRADGERVLEVAQDSTRRVVLAEHGAGEHRQRLRFGVAASGLLGAARGDVHNAGDGNRYEHEQQEREQVVRLGDGEGVEGRGEEPVEQQARRNRGRDRWPEPAHHGNRNDCSQVDEQLVGERQV
jgi:hypothetical protein